jgi:hypothetical protein
VYGELLFIGNMSAVEEKHYTTQDVICIMEQWAGGEAMPLSSVNLI